MKYKVLYQSGTKTDSILIDINSDNTVKRFKEDLGIFLEIMPEYIYLKHNNTVIEDSKYLYEYNIQMEDELYVYLEVTVCEVSLSTSDNHNYLKFFMQYDDNVSKLKADYLSLRNIPDIKLCYMAVPIQYEYLRHYLKEKDCIFTVFGKHTVTITNKFGISCNIETYINDKIMDIKNNLIQQNLLNDAFEILMIENTVLTNDDNLLNYREFIPFNICIGFPISVNNNNENLLYFNVNYNTKISYLKAPLAKIFEIASENVSLFYMNNELEDEKSIGFYNINEGALLNMIVGINISILHTNENKIINYYFKKYQKVIDVKKMVSKLCFTDKSNIILTLEEEELKDQATIESLKCGTGSIIKMVINGYPFIENLEEMCIKNNEKKDLKIQKELILPNSIDFLKISNDIILPKKYDLNYNESNQYNKKNKILNTNDKMQSSDNDKNILEKEFSNLTSSKSFNEDAEELEVRKQSYSTYENIIYEDNDKLQVNCNISLMVINLKDNIHENSIFRISIERTCSVQHLKSVISCGSGVKIGEFDVYYLGDIFCGGSLDTFGVKNNHSIVLKSRNNQRKVDEQFIIKVRMMKNNTENENINSFLIDDYQTIGGLKKIIRRQYNVNIERITLLFREEELDNDIVIKEMDIESGSTFTAIIKDKDNGEREEIEIKVKNGFHVEGLNSCKNICISYNDTVETLRRKVEDMFELSSINFVLSFEDEILKSENMLTTYSIKNDNEVLISKSLLVRYFTGGDQFSARVNRYGFLSEDKVLDLKLKIKKMLKIDTKFIQLHFNGCSLEDENTLEEYEIENDSYLMMVSTLAGGV